MRKHQRADWSNINHDILGYIQKRLPLPDIITCRAVCRSWRSITKTNMTSTLISPSPGPSLLMFSFDSCNLSRCYFLDHIKRNTGEYFFLANHNSYELLSKVTDCVGYSHGWFLFLDNPKKKNQKRSLCLFHPSCSKVPLCSGKRLATVEGTRKICIEKAALFGDPIFGTFGVVVIHGGNLWFANFGDRKFTKLEKQFHYGERPDQHDDPCKVFKDVLCFNNCIYGFTFTDEGRRHRIEVWDCTIGRYSPPKTLDFELQFDDVPKFLGHSKQSTMRLVESEGELLLVSFRLYKLVGLRRPRFHSWAFEWTDTCSVYKMDFKEKVWVQMSGLGDRVLFIMDFQAMSLPSHEFPQYQKNSIYFKLDRLGNHANRVCVFNMETRRKSYVRLEKACGRFY